MIHMISQWLKKVRDAYGVRREYFGWVVGGKPLPPPHFVKQRAIRAYARKFSLDTLVETGTYLGDMVKAQERYFRRIISVELSQSLCMKARERFLNSPHVELMEGDSGMLIRSIVASLERPALFWLDGHYSGGITAKGSSETPIVQELDAILTTPQRHVILIDDARLFSGSKDYPTIDLLISIAEKAGYTLTVKDDIIRLTSFVR